MADLLGNDTDLEDNKYYEAQLAFEAGIDPAIEKNKKSAFNADTGKHEILMPMPEGGYIKIGEEGGKVDPPPSVLIEGMEFGPETPEFQRYYPAPQVMDEAPMQPETPSMEVDPMQVAGAQRYAEDLQAQTGSYSMEDLEAAGYGADVAEAAGLVSPVEPMSQEEIAKIVSEGGSLIGPYDPTIREDGVAILREFSIEASEQELREELAAAGADPRTIELEVQAAMPSIRSEADILSNAVFGTGNPLGIGAADFVTLGVMDIQEGSRMFQQNRGPNGSVAGRAIGTLLVLAGVAEATGVGMVAGKLLKKAAMKLQGPMVRAGEQAQQRIAQEGSTLFSNPVGPAVDRGLAAAGKLVAPKLDTLNDFVSLASKGQLRQARTTEQDINDIMQKKMPATKITMQGASEDLSTAYETGEITDQLEQAGLFFEDDMMGTIFVGTTQDNLNAIKTAKTPAEIGKLSGYSDADIAAFYLKRRGGDKESAFSEYSSDLNIEEGGRLVAPKLEDGLPGRISTRLPTAKASTEDPMTGELIVGLEEMKADPALYEFNVNITKDYPNMKAVEGEAVDETSERFIGHVKDNLLYLHDKVPPNTRVRSQKWYDGARNITENWSQEYDVPDTSIAGALAALSPQKDWYQNVSLAQRVLDVAIKKKEFKFSDEMEQRFRSLPSLNKPRYEPMLDAIKGKSYDEIIDEDPAVQSGLRALFVRLYDQTYNKPDYQIVGPEGDFLQTATNANGSPSKAAWGSLNEIGKAVASIDARGDVNTISRLMGERHKVRNFYNNIYDPNSPFGDVTIDTHAVAAGLLRPLSGNSLEVDHNFKNMSVKGRGTTKGSSKTGVSGNYGLYAEAYRRAAAERGILPRQMQSITWEAVRGLFTDKFKQSAKNVADVDQIWQRYKNNEIDLDETRRLVDERAGGVNPPTWE